ncbi:hypothetical protein KFK09_017213 [Dendrobium nobile]|uniref:Uncharacterized protein n=1 Tax=Dendrobium nobile TaxID=94219 RepID=A0A8T3B0D9_DENNO|nr:hypothetical protein KFK09_017213 [Dendrobium nobile]
MAYIHIMKVDNVPNQYQFRDEFSSWLQADPKYSDSKGTFDLNPLSFDSLKPKINDSPTSIFFNNLSPIKVTSSRLSSQAFDNVDVPSPPPVFATPQNRLINSKMWKRSENLAFPGSQKICPGDADLVGTSLEYPDATIQFIPVAAAQLSNSSDKQYNNDHHPQDEVCRGLSNGVDEFFSIPSEDCENTSCSPGFFLGEADDLARDKEITPFSSNGDQMAFFNADSAQFPAVKSAATVTNSVAEYTKHLNLVSTLTCNQIRMLFLKNFQKILLPMKGLTRSFLSQMLAIVPT